MNRLPCPACKTILQFPDELAGRSLSCPKCKKVLRVSLAGSPGRSPALPADTPAPGSGPILRPPSRKKADRSRPLVAALAAVVLFLGAGGVGVYYLADGGSQPAPHKPSPPTQQAAVRESQKPQRLADKPAPTVAADQLREKPTALKPADSAPQTPPADKTVSLPPPNPAKVEPPSPPVVSKPAPPPRPTNEPGEKDGTTLEAQVLARLNSLRVRAGVITVRLDRDLCRGCRDHARYLVGNAMLLSQDGASPYWEDAQLPGFTELGARVAPSAWIDDKSPLGAIDRWAASPLHRTVLLSPRLQVMGLGLARAAGQDGFSSVFRFSLDQPRPTAGAVLFPADQQTGVPLAFPGNEIPDPLPDTNDKVAGYPITVTFPGKTHIDKPSFDLEDDRGKAVEAWFSWPARPANKKYVPHQRNTICVIGKKPLRPGCRYTVRISAQIEGKRWSSTWSFVTLGHDEKRHAIESQVLARLNAYRKASGLPEVSLDPVLAQACTAHASYVARNRINNPGLNLRDQDPKLPGYSEEGQRAARQSLVHPFGGPEDMVDGMMASILNRNFLLNPPLTRMGVGFAPHHGLGYYWFLHAPFKSTAAGRLEPVLFPADNQQGVRRSYPPKEKPSPVPSEAKTAGFAITAMFSRGPLTNIKARLTDRDGKEVACWLHMADKPLIKGAPPGLVGLLPQQMLAGDSDYKVSMSARINGRPWQRQWAFHTVATPEARQQEMADRILVRVNELRKAAGLTPVKLDPKLSQACLLHARYLVTNAHQAAVQGLGVHNEDPKLPDATAEGAKAGKASVICRSPDPLTCADGWVSTLYHRIPLLSPDLKRIGFAALFHYEDSDWYSVLDSGRGK